jgi:hypothetical protein
MRYMFRPHRAIFRQQIFKESTALCTLSNSTLKVRHCCYYLFCYYRMFVLPIFYTAAALCPTGCAAPLVVCILCWFVLLIKHVKHYILESAWCPNMMVCSHNAVYINSNRGIGQKRTDLSLGKQETCNLSTPILIYLYIWCGQVFNSSFTVTVPVYFR